MKEEEKDLSSMTNKINQTQQQKPNQNNQTPNSKPNMKPYISYEESFSEITKNTNTIGINQLNQTIFSIPLWRKFQG